MTLKVVPFQVEHLRALPPPRLAHTGPILERAAETPALRDHLESKAVTIFCHGHPIAAFGLWPQWEGVWSCWAWITAECEQHALGLIRIARAHVQRAQLELGAKRIQAEVSCDLPGGARLAELIGFECEGRMRRFGLGGRGDYWMLSIIDKE